MKSRKLLTAMFLVSMISIAFNMTPNSALASGVYTVEQAGVSQMVQPIKGTDSAAVFYDYFSASAHTPYVEDGVSKIYLYQDTTSGELSLIIHHSIDNGPTTNMVVRFNLEGVPTGATRTLSDDGNEFNLAREPEGIWRFWHNTDGGVVGGLTGSWCITVTPLEFTNIHTWHYQLADPADFIDLDMDLPIKICCKPPSGVPLFSDIIAILPLGIVVGVMGIKRHRKANN